MLAGNLSPQFRAFVEQEEAGGRALHVDHLLVLQHLLRHSELDTATAARICQRREASARELLSRMEREREYLNRGGTGRGTYWTLRPEQHRKLSPAGHPERDQCMDWEVAKTRVLSVLKQRAERGEPGLSNGDIRRMTLLDRNQVRRLMDQLRAEEPRVGSPGRGRYAGYSYKMDQRAGPTRRALNRALRAL